MSDDLVLPLDTPRLTLRLLEIDDAPVLQQVFAAAGDYFLSITGRPAPDPDAAERELRSSAATEGRRVALVSIRGTGEPVGALGWWQHHPEPDVALLGMLLIVPGRRGEGLAREALSGLEQWLQSQGVHRLRTGVGAGDHAKHGLLQALGFAAMDARRHVSLDRGRMMIALFEKTLA